MTRILLLVITITLGASGVLAQNAFHSAEIPQNSICVLNETSEPHFFAIDADTAGRWSGTILPAGYLCSTSLAANTVGFVSAFDDEDAIEGCSRLARANAPETLLAYADFDRCTWADAAN